MPLFHIAVPPIKSQGIKTKLIPWIARTIFPDNNGRWIEPFMGTGAVGFNLANSTALLCDTNPHLINFYNSIRKRKVTPGIVRSFLQTEGDILKREGEKHYYYIRDRFNNEHSELDFLFLNRACFNGMIRFNKKGEFNVPFCRKPERFAPAYITKIVNQVNWLTNLFQVRTFEFHCQNFVDTISRAQKNDLIYADPPYIDRHADYYNGWSEKDEQMLFEALVKAPCRFVLSTWHHNDFRENQYIEKYWNHFNVITQEHFYHLGAKESNRHPIVEALVCNFIPADTNSSDSVSEQWAQQSFFELA